MKMVDMFCEKDVCEKFATPSGSPIKEVFIGKYEDDGKIHLTKTGEVNVYQEIQSYEMESDINVLLQRAQNGDLSVFRSVVYGDTTTMPETPAEALNFVIQAERDFNRLPQEIKDKFKNNWRAFLATAGSDEWLEKMGFDLHEKDQKDDSGADPKEVIENVEKQ